MEIFTLRTHPGLLSLKLEGLFAADSADEGGAAGAVVGDGDVVGLAAVVGDEFDARLGVVLGDRLRNHRLQLRVRRCAQKITKLRISPSNDILDKN